MGAKPFHGPVFVAFYASMACTCVQSRGLQSVVHTLTFHKIFIMNIFQVIDDLSSRLEKRESQLLAVSKDKARLEEECDNLKE